MTDAPAPPARSRVKRALGFAGAGLAGLYLLLLIPDSAPAPLPPTPRSPFAWNQDDRWKELERRFAEARRRPPEELRKAFDEEAQRTIELLSGWRTESVSPDDPLYPKLEERIFSLGVLTAACPDLLPRFSILTGTIRDAVKTWSQRWDLHAPAVRIRLYRILYGSRAALEEAMSQAPPGSVPALAPGVDEPSRTPSAVIHGVRIHSGDILVSRGGAPTSALIARGNDFPGNFSHVALVHVDAATSRVSVIEAHIERGVAISTVEQYLQDQKLRILALRLRADLPAIARNPMLPHEAATLALDRAQREHIPYDFTMDFKDHSEIFCSEVASAVYDQAGVTLWMGLSTLSSPGLCSWLSAFGVRHSVTQEPSDLEYDPQLRVVAEWRDPETLFKDRLDNAVVDVLLEGAERGEGLDYSLWMLPVARGTKAWSWTLNRFGGIGPIPEGMNATAALKMDRFQTRHDVYRRRLLERATEFQSKNGYRPPYWELLRLAREVVRP